VIVTLGGNDVVDAANLATVCAGKGDDWVDLRWKSRVFLGPGDDVVTVSNRGRGKDLVRGGTGADLISTGGDDDKVFGGSGNDVIEGGIEDDALWGDYGSDRIYGRKGNDQLVGGPGLDRLRPGSRDPLEWVYSQKRNGFRTILVRRGRVLDTIFFRLPMRCEQRDRIGIGVAENWRSIQRSAPDVPLRGASGHFKVVDSQNEDWFNFDFAMRGREIGATLTGQVRYVDSDRTTCWSGRSLTDAWVDFRAVLQPVVRQTVRP
jgi:hypothetical protein